MSQMQSTGIRDEVCSVCYRCHVTKTDSELKDQVHDITSIGHEQELSKIEEDLNRVRKHTNTQPSM